MKMISIAALVAVQVSAVPAPAQAAEPSPGASMERMDPADDRSRTVVEEGAELNRGDGPSQALRTGGARESSRAAAAREDEPRKRKSTGDKVLTGAAVVLGIGALAVGGLLVAIFVG